MKNKLHAARCMLHAFLLMIFIIFTSTAGFSQQPDSGQPAPQQQEIKPAENQVAGTQPETQGLEVLNKSQNVTLDFKDADIRNVLKIISYKSGVNIVASPEVIGNISIRLVEVPWEKALDVILKTYGFAYERQGNIINIAPIDKLTAQKKQEAEFAQVQPTMAEVFAPKYIDIKDAQKALEPQLSSRGKITILEMSKEYGRSSVLLVNDIPPIIDKIREVMKRIDVLSLAALNNEGSKIEPEGVSRALSLEGIIYEKDGLSYAIVNGKICKVEDEIDSYRLVKIEEDKVTFINKEGKYTELKLEKEAQQ